MPLQIMKPAITTDSTVTVVPTVKRFFNEAAETVTGKGNLTIAVEDFWTDTGADATALPALTADNSYYNVYVNGVLQMEDLLDYTPGGSGTGKLVITVPTGSTIEQHSPVVLVVTYFAPTSDITIFN
ncbi:MULTISPECIES: DUF4183 domain-containing protein [Bacillus]|uniref:DUF4183 domain-containing protein n=2 Tax=Bacillus TaxID=1386 RepID=A0A0M4FK47_9BACI|nr:MULTISPECIES: DUF4183 domain-containing protein [Bacillus]ALC82017.1 hypothetical protein AM592_10680 [Bacillus gobiensis]MBP1083359.1 hypothetical protein [Bacillus capparidis]MED1097791.1 DUF4183 domain-containing protein [Bacillus capparidis]